MSSDEIAIRLDRVGKCYPLYDRPADRLKQFVLPEINRVLGRGVPRYFREHWALRDVSFEVLRGEQLGIVGRNGAGKSTLLQVICNTLAPTTGTIEVKGRVAALLELGAGFNLQFTGEENLFFNGTVLGLSRAQIEQRYDRILAFADIGDFIHQPVKNYSSGMYMRLAFAIAAHVDPDILVVDEALSVGDEAFQRKCHARIQAIRDDGATILFVSHSAGHVTEVCNRALLIDAGEMLAIGPARPVVSRYQKLLYAPATKVAAIRDSLRNEHLGIAAVNAEHGTDGIVKNPLPDADPAAWDEGMLPQSTVVYSDQGCAVLLPHVQTLDGRRVNVLQPGRDYVYCYRARFDTAAVAVRFGMMIKTVTGVELAGAVSAGQPSPLQHVAAGDEVEVRFAFRAMLAPGTYFLNAGVVGLIGEQEHYLCRHVDAAMFRVMSDPDTLATGLVDLDIRPQIRAIGEGDDAAGV